MKKILVTLVLAVFCTVPTLSLASSHNTNPLGVDTSDPDISTCFFFGTICTNAGYNPPDQFITTGGDASSNSRTVSGSRVNITDAQIFIISFGYFINNILLPLLFGIALLIFLINATRYFILGGGNEQDREKAKRLAIYGIAAFVFLVSIWGIVNVIVRGLDIDQDQSLCPDYLGNWCGNQDYSTTRGVGFRIPTDTRNSQPGGSNNPLTNSNGTNNTSTSSTQTSAIARLVFGTYGDVSSLNFTPGVPRAINSTVNIASDATCTVGIDTLMLAAKVESTQVAYLLYTDSSGSTRWSNVTDISFTNGLAYDADTITSIIGNGATDVYLIHTHQQDNAESAGLQANGYVPSASDMNLMCDSLLQNVTHVTVDANSVWTLTQAGDVCPRRSDEEDVFQSIESLTLLSQVQNGDRAQEYEDLINSNLISNQAQLDLQEFSNVSFDGIGTGEILTLSESLQNQAGLTLTRYGTNEFCFSL